jgi:hypothetical protein
VHKYTNNEIVGYRVNIKLKDQMYSKDFISKNCTLADNLEQAKKWLNEINDGILDDKIYKRPNGLPKNIMYKYEKGEIIGYRVGIKINGKTHSNDFGSRKYTMEEKLEQALKFKKSILPE